MEEENEKVETTQPNNSSQSKESNKWMIVTVIILVAVLAFILIFMIEDVSEIVDRNTTLCIANNSTFYGVEWCSYCQKQKALFGTNIDLINYIDCDEDRDACIAANIEIYPTWIINGIKHTGLMYEEELKESTGC